MIYEVSIYDNVIFDDNDGITSTTQIGLLDETINFSDSLDSHSYSASLNDTITFLEGVIINGGSLHIVVLSDSVAFNDFTTPRPLTVFGDFLYIYDWLETGNGILDDELVFDDTITGESGPEMDDSITLDDSIAYTLTGNLVSADTVSLVDGFSGFVNDWRVVVVPIAEERS